MNISKDHVVEIDYTLTNDAGETLDSSQGGQPLVYLHGHQNIIPGLEKELEGKTLDDEIKTSVDPKEGYGVKSDELVTTVPKAELSSIPNLEVGMQLQAETDQGHQSFTIVKIEEENVVLDGNHPLAGQTLHFDVKVKSVRKATEEELSHGHVHGPGGHQH